MTTRCRDRTLAVAGRLGVVGLQADWEISTGHTTTEKMHIPTIISHMRTIVPGLGIAGHRTMTKGPAAMMTLIDIPNSAYE